MIKDNCDFGSSCMQVFFIRSIQVKDEINLIESLVTL